jgi:putative transposase
VKGAHHDVRQAVLVAVAVDEDGRRQILAVEFANRESRSSWCDFLLGLKSRGLAGVEFVVSDDHPGLKQAIREVLTEAAWQRCYVGLLKNSCDEGGGPNLCLGELGTADVGGEGSAPA